MWSKDLKPQPKKGRAFPYRFGDAVRLVKYFALTQYNGKRISVRFENTDEECYYGTPLLDYMPEEELAIYSLPENQCSENLKSAVEQSLSKIVAFKKMPTDKIHSSFFSAYLTTDGSVQLTRIDTTYKSKSYKGNDKLSNAGKVSSRSKEVELEIFSIHK